MTIIPRNMFEQYSQTPIEFNSLEELVNLPFVKHYKNKKDFYRFSITNSKSKMLMAEYNEGSVFWVVGFLSEAIEGLTEWTPPESNTEDTPKTLTSQLVHATYTGMYIEGFK